jgi:hypothetical protein
MDLSPAADHVRAKSLQPYGLGDQRNISVGNDLPMPTTSKIVAVRPLAFMSVKFSNGQNVCSKPRLWRPELAILFQGTIALNSEGNGQTALVVRAIVESPVRREADGLVVARRVVISLSPRAGSTMAMLTEATATHRIGAEPTLSRRSRGETTFEAEWIFTGENSSAIHCRPKSEGSSAAIPKFNGTEAALLDEGLLAGILGHPR